MSEEGGEAVVAAAEPAEAKEKKPAAKKAKATKKPKAADTHPKYSQMIAEAINTLKERNGSSRQAILKYIMANYRVDKDERVVNNHLKMSLRAGIKNGAVKQLKGVGASGSFKLGDKVSKVEKKKPAAKKSATPKQKSKPSGKALSKVKKPKAAASKTKKSPKKAKSAAKSSEKKSAKKSPKKSKKAAKKTVKKTKKGKASKPAAEASEVNKEESTSE